MFAGHSLNAAAHAAAHAAAPGAAVITAAFRFVWRMLHRGAGAVLLAIWRACAAAGEWAVGGIQATGRAIGQGIRRTVRGVRSAIASVYWSGRNLINKARRAIWAAAAYVFRSIKNLIIGSWLALAAGILSAGRANLRFMRWTRHAIATGGASAARLAAAPFIGARRATIRLTRHAGSAAGARFRRITAGLAPTTMTLSMEDGHARLLVFKGDQIVAWRSGQIAQALEDSTEAPSAGPDGASPEAGPKTGPEAELEEGPTERAGTPVFGPLGPLLESLPFRSKRVVADLPLHVPLLRHVPIPDVKGRFLKEIVTAEVLDSVPFAADEVDIRWRISALNKGEDATGKTGREASVIAVPREHMDGQVGIIRDSHLAPSAIYPKAAALAAAVARPNVFILHLTDAQTTVVLVRDGVPRIVHRLELPRDTADQAETIAMGVEQVAGYHRSQQPEDDVSGFPVVVTGEVDQMHGLLGPLAATLDRPVQTFHTELDCPDGFDPAEYVSNIGLFLASRSKESAKTIAAQNVLPERHRPRPLPVAQAAVFTALLGLGFLAFNLTGWVSGIAGELGPLNARLDIRAGQARDYRLAIARYGVIDQRISEAEAEALELEANLRLLKTEMDTLMSRIGDITGIAATSNVELSRLVPLPEGFSVSGAADSYSDVLTYTASLRSSPNFEDATVLQVADSSGSQLGFTVVVTVPTPEPDDDDEDGSKARSP